MKRLLYLALIITLCGTGQSYTQDNRINFNDQELFLSGMNLAWINYANDLTNFDADEFTRALDEVKEAKGNTIRWWLHINGTSSPQFTGDSVSGITDTEIESVKTALDLAQERGMGLVLCLWSFGMLDTGNGNLNEDQTQRNRLMLEDTTYTRAYINNALIPLVDSLKGHPAIVCWEIFNEPEGMASDAHGWAGWLENLTSFTNIQRFMNLTTGAIHRTDTSALVSSGAWNVAVNTDISVGGAIGGGENLYKDSELIAAGNDPDGTLDFYMIHFYPDHGQSSSPFHHPASHWDLDKPIVVAEFRADNPYPDYPADSAFQYLYDNGYAGALAWTWTGHDGNGDTQDARPGMEYLWNNHRADVEVLIDSSKLDFTPYIAEPIPDTAIVIPEDSVIFKYMDLKDVFYDVEDSTNLAYSIEELTDSSLVAIEIDGDDSLTIGIKPGQPGICNIRIRATDSASKFVEETFSISIYDSTTDDYALFRSVSASSNENSDHYALYAVDGDPDTRWSSEYDDDQWLQVKFEKVRTIRRIFMTWEAAYGEIYNILTSMDGENWDTTFAEPYGNGGSDLIVLDATDAMYVRMDGMQRGTEWGYSLWNFEVYSTPGTNTAPVVATDAPDTVYATTEEELDQSASVFFNDDTPGDQHNYHATLDGGGEITGWLSFETPGSHSDAAFVGTPGESDIGSQTIELEATDRYGETASTSFVVTVVPNEPDAVENTISSGISVYPNPATNSLMINSTTISSVEIIDLQGRTYKTINTENLSGATFEISIDDLEEGMYMILLHNDNKTIVQKFSKK